MADPRLRVHRLWTQHEVAPVEKVVAEGIRARVTVHDRDGIIRAVTWLQLLLAKWTEKLRGYHKIGETAVMPGAKLAALVAKHMRTVFTEQRRRWRMTSTIVRGLGTRRPRWCRCFSG